MEMSLFLIRIASGSDRDQVPTQCEHTERKREEALISADFPDSGDYSRCVSIIPEASGESA